MSVLVDVAEAIKDELAAAFAASTFGASYSRVVPERSYADWDEELTGCRDLRVDVVPVGPNNPTVDTETRGEWSYVVLVDIGVRQWFGSESQDVDTGRIDVSEIDALVRLTQKIGEFFMPAQSEQTGRALTNLPAAVWLPRVGDKSGTEYRASFIREHLREIRQFTSIVQLAYGVSKGPD